jgi:hypothetical protein
MTDILRYDEQRTEEWIRALCSVDHPYFKPRLPAIAAQIASLGGVIGRPIGDVIIVDDGESWMVERKKLNDQTETGLNGTYPRRWTLYGVWMPEKTQ